MIRMRLIPNDGYPEHEGAVWFKRFFKRRGDYNVEITRDFAAAAVFQDEAEAKRVLGDRYEEFEVEHIS